MVTAADDALKSLGGGSLSDRYRLQEAVLQWFRRDLAAARARPRPPAPECYPYGVSAQGAELLCADWMRHLGAADVGVTAFNHDGGIDITSRLHVAQVKHWAGSVGAPTVRQIAGVAAVDGRAGIVFTSGSFTREAVSFADAANVLLFVFAPEHGTLSAQSRAARKALDEGLDDAKTIQAGRAEHARRERFG